MILFKRVVDLQNFLKKNREAGNSIGFVPTMGALHQGHLSLISYSLKRCDLTVCSIFVNPTQFNEKTDLKAYPRTPESDIEMLTSAGCQVLFMPSVEEVYPDGIDTKKAFDFGYLDKPMEGANRPGHFAGMAQVVNRLLEIVGPNCLFMGQKDYQQFAIVQEMLKQQQSHIELIMCPIIREEDGLAMSSRNVRLSEAQRILANNINRTLIKAKELMPEQSPEAISEMALSMLSLPGMQPEYFEIVDGLTLRKIEHFIDAESVVACTAVRLGAIRLIDNLVLKP